MNLPPISYAPARLASSAISVGRLDFEQKIQFDGRSAAPAPFPRPLAVSVRAAQPQHLTLADAFLNCANSQFVTKVKPEPSESKAPELEHLVLNVPLLQRSSATYDFPLVTHEKTRTAIEICRSVVNTYDRIHLSLREQFPMIAISVLCFCLFGPVIYLLSAALPYILMGSAASLVEAYSLAQIVLCGLLFLINSAFCFKLSKVSGQKAMGLAMCALFPATLATDMLFRLTSFGAFVIGLPLIFQILLILAIGITILSPAFIFRFQIRELLQRYESLDYLLAKPLDQQHALSVLANNFYPELQAQWRNDVQALRALKPNLNAATDCRVGLCLQQNKDASLKDIIDHLVELYKSDPHRDEAVLFSRVQNILSHVALDPVV